MEWHPDTTPEQKTLATKAVYCVAMGLEALANKNLSEAEHWFLQTDRLKDEVILSADVIE